MCVGSYVCYLYLVPMVSMFHGHFLALVAGQYGTQKNCHLYATPVQLDCFLNRRTWQIIFQTKRKDYGKSKTKYEKLSARRIQIFWIHLCVIHFWPLFSKNFQNNVQTKMNIKHWIWFAECSFAEVTGRSFWGALFCLRIGFFRYSRKLSWCTRAW